MHPHGRVAIKAFDRAAGAGEEGAEGLPAADLRGGDDERGPVRGAAVNGPVHGEVGGLADRADMRRAVERGADLVVQDRRAERAQAGEDGRQVGVHPVGAARASVAGDADAAHPVQAGKLVRRRQVEEENGGKPREAQHLQHGGRSGEVVAVPGNERTGRWKRAERGGGGARRHAKVRRAVASAGRQRAYSAAGTPAIAAAQASRRASTPAPGPPGWPMMPPPAA